MEKELLNNEKQLLLTDLCARLPHGVKIRIEYPFLKEEEWHSEILYGLDLQRLCIANTSIRIEEFKPYLFPLSSMTEEQLRYIYEHYVDISKIEYDEFYENAMRQNCFIIEYTSIIDFIDYLYKKHIDFRGLIPMGLAIDCTNLKIY